MVTKVVSLIAGIGMAESQVVEVLYKYGGQVLGFPGLGPLR